MARSSSRIRAQSHSLEMGVEWQVGGEDLVKDERYADEEEKGRLRSRSEEFIHTHYRANESRELPYGFGSLSVDDELRSSTRHGFKGAPLKKVAVTNGSTGCIVCSVTIFALTMALVGMWIMPAPVALMSLNEQSGNLWSPG